ncbi:MAG: polysaccharide biosynthesis C-terminal domain-containing protein [Porcipelethomonas sp.]
MNKSKIVKDTFFLTSIDLALQGLSLILNVFITRKLGAAATGTISLINTFFCFTAIISSANIFLCSSRLISEEIGKECGNPSRIFRFGMMFSMPISILTAVIIFIFAEVLGNKVLHSREMINAIRILAFSLPLNSAASCIKGYFNAYRKVSVTAASGAFEFLVKSGLFALFAEFMVSTGKMDVFTAFSVSIGSGQLAGFLFLLFFYIHFRKKSCCSASISFKRFIFFSVPIILNSIVTAVLSSANDALVPLTLKQYGNSTNEALSQFGIFEAIIIPALFFPSGILCSLSSILIPELSREKGAGDMKRTAGITNKVLRQTFSFSIFVAAVFLCFGEEIGFLMSGENFAGKILKILSPAIPFIYLEIILEAILKGMGRHSFSSLNYLVEYTIRISVLLICVPIFGFYGIVASYLASNIICNTTRIIMIIKITGIKFNVSDNLIIPIISAVFSMQVVTVIDHYIHLNFMNIIAETTIFTIISAILYILVQKIIYRICDSKFEIDCTNV